MGYHNPISQAPSLYCRSENRPLDFLRVLLHHDAVLLRYPDPDLVSGGGHSLVVRRAATGDFRHACLPRLPPGVDELVVHHCPAVLDFSV